MGKVGPIGEALEVLQEEVEKGISTAKQQITGKGQKPFGGTGGSPRGLTPRGKQPFGQAQGKQGQQTSSQSQPQKPSDQGKPSEDLTADLKQAAEVADTSQEETKTFLKGIYGSTPELTEAEIKKKELEDKQKQETLRQQLHGQYYQRLTTPSKPQEERPQEKSQREEEEKEMAELKEEEEEKKKELPIIVTKDMGTKEKLRGVSG